MFPGSLHKDAWVEEVWDEWGPSRSWIIFLEFLWLVIWTYGVFLHLLNSDNFYWSWGYLNTGGFKERWVNGWIFLLVFSARCNLSLTCQMDLESLSTLEDKPIPFWCSFRGLILFIFLFWVKILIFIASLSYSWTTLWNIFIIISMVLPCGYIFFCSS